MNWLLHTRDVQPPVQVIFGNMIRASNVGYGHPITHGAHIISFHKRILLLETLNCLYCSYRRDNRDAYRKK